MTAIFRGKLPLLLCLSAWLVVGCKLEKRKETEAEKNRVEVDGSSTVFPISERMKTEFEQANQDAEVLVSLSGTGSGFKKFARGELDISDASRKIKPGEVAALDEKKIGFIELPVAIDGLTVVVNKENDWCKELTVEQLKDIWKDGSTIKTWKDLNDKWPPHEIKLVGPDDNSGTQQYFAEEIVGKVKDDKGRSKPAPLRNFTKNTDDQYVVNEVAGSKYAMGFFGYAFYLKAKDKLKAVAVVPRGGTKGVAPTKETIESSEYEPLSRRLFIYISKNSLKKKVVADFVTFYLDNLGTVVPKVGYVTLPEAEARTSKDRLAEALKEFDKPNE